MDTSARKECLPVGGPTTNSTIGGSKPLHRFLRGEPKSVGIVMMFMGSSLFIFGIPLKMDVAAQTSSDIFSSFWLGILYFTCGLLYVLAEREPTKKIITASLALSILSTIGSVVAAIDFIACMEFISHQHFNEYYNHYLEHVNYSTMEDAVRNHYMPIYSLEAVFLFHDLLGAVIVVTMTVFARLALRSTHSQAVVVMRNLPATE